MAPCSFELKLRIPGCAKSATVNGTVAQPGTFFVMDQVWSGTTEIVVALGARLRDRCPAPKDAGALARPAAVQRGH